MTQPDIDVLVAELAQLHANARGCEFDLVPADGPIARLALFMHDNGDRVVEALRQQPKPAPVEGLREALERSEFSDKSSAKQIALTLAAGIRARPELRKLHADADERALRDAGFIVAGINVALNPPSNEGMDR